MSTLQIQTARVFTPLLESSRYKGAHGGRGCVHPDTLIDTPSGRVAIKNFEGGEVYSYFQGKKVVGVASPAKPYTEEDLYEFQLESGQSIIVTDEHRFLTPSGWKYASALSKSDEVVIEREQVSKDLPQSSLDIFLSRLREGARHWTGKAVNYLDDCWLYLRQYDPRLRFLEGSGQVSLPSQVDGLPHNLRVSFYEDDLAYGDKDSLSSFSHRSSSHAVLPSGEGRYCEEKGNYSDEKFSEQPLAFFRFFQRFLCCIDLVRPAYRREALPSGCGHEKRQERTPEMPADRLLHGVSDTCFTVTKIGLIRKHSRQVYWDLHVPFYENYLSNGIVNHNSGKSHFFAESVVEKCVLKPGSRIVCVREVQRSLKESVKLLIEDKIRAFGLQGSFNILNDHIVTPGNGIIIFNGMADHTADSIKSLEGFDIAYAEEAQTLTERSLELLRPTIRAPGSELWFSWNPRNADDPVDRFLRNDPPEGSVVVEANYSDNPWFPVELEQERAFDEINNPSRYGHVWLGEYEPQAVGAIWHREIIDRNRRKEAPRMKRILVGVDPPISSEKGSDECGIVVGGLGEDGRGYVLNDFSTHGTPRQWAERVVAAYDLHDADGIVAEVNQGGEMVENTIQSVRPGISVIPVRATRGKHIRAEPISALDALDKISHIGHFPKMEAQMYLFTAEGYMGNDSPDRADARIWVFHALFEKMTRPEKSRQRPTGRINNRYNPHRAYGTR